MKRLAGILALGLLVMQSIGCGVLDKQVRAEYPIGFEKLGKIAPKCDSDPATSGCSTGAMILEAPNPEKATVLFLKDWDRTVFGTYAEKAKNANMRLDIVGSIVYGNAQRDLIRGLNDYAVPALKQVYRTNLSDYSKKMDKMLDLVELDSKSSFDTFRDAHSKAIMN